MGRLLLFTLFAFVLLGLAGCPGSSPPPTETRKSTSITVEDAKDATIRGQKKLDDAQKKATAIQPKIAATNDADLIAGFSAMWEDIKGAMDDFRESVTRAVDAQLKASQDQKELEDYRKADPIKKKVQEISIGFFSLAAAIAVVIVVSLLVKPVGALLSQYVSTEDLILAIIAFAMLGALFGALARWLRAVEDILLATGGAVVTVGLLVCAYKWWRIKYAGVKPIVQFIDHASQMGALQWTPEATALANKMQGKLAKRLVDTFQHNGVANKSGGTNTATGVVIPAPQ